MVVGNGKPGVSIIINHKQYFAPRDAMTGLELKELAAIPIGNALYLEKHGSEPDERVRDDQLVVLRPGMHFYDLPLGVVGAPSARFPDRT